MQTNLLSADLAVRTEFGKDEVTFGNAPCSFNLLHHSPFTEDGLADLARKGSVLGCDLEPLVSERPLELLPVLRSDRLTGVTSK